LLAGYVIAKISVISCVGYRSCPKVQPFTTELKHSLPKNHWGNSLSRHVRWRVI